MRCDYFQQGLCRSCPHITVTYDQQLSSRQNYVQHALADIPATQDMHWLPPVASDESNYRIKAKMAVGGRPGQPTLGLLDSDWSGIDLTGCPILTPELRAAMPALTQFIAELKLEPYDVAARTGEVKYVHVTVSHAGEYMVRFVLRSRQYEALLRSRLPRLKQLLERVAVVSINLLPQHAALTEGNEEIVLTQDSTMPIRFGDVDLRIGPRSFIQTNVGVASQLYRQVAAWIRQLSVQDTRVWDLYCGVGGFALHAALGGARSVVGIEISDRAIASADEAAVKLFGDQASQRTRFIEADARVWTQERQSRPDVLIVNPPRRGIGTELADWVNDSGIETFVYSSCNPKTLAADLQRLTNYRVREGRLFDMFAHTDHCEVAVLCERRA